MKKLFYLLVLIGLASCEEDTVEQPSTTLEKVTVTPIKVNSSATFTDFAFGSSQTGYICGEMGTLFKTTDSGKNWSSVQTGISPSLNCIAAISENNIFMARNELYHTTNGGANWASAGLDNIGSGIFDIKFLNANVGFIAKNGIMKTIDGGTTWELVYDSANDPDYYALVFRKIEFVNNQIGYSCGGKTYDGSSVGTMVKTTDGGETWINLKMDMSQITSFHFLDQNRGFVFNFAREMWKTDDGGKNWIKVSSEVPDSYVDCYFVDADNIVLKTSESIYHSTDGGKSWEKDYTTPESTYLSRMRFVSKTKGFVVGNNGLVASIEID